MASDDDSFWDERNGSGVKAPVVDLPFTQRGGIWVRGGMLGSFSATWPFATIRVDQERVTVRALGSCYKFPKAHSTHVQNHSGLFSKGVLLSNDDMISPRDLIFWSFNRPALKAALRKGGFSGSQKD